MKTVALAACCGGAAAYAYFSRSAPMRVRIGMAEIDAEVPASYQAAVFPAFAGFCAALAHDAANGRRVMPRAALLGATGVLALLRLDGRVPVSGHAVFLAAAAAFEILGPSRGAERWLLAALAAGGLAVTARAKLRWGDGTWLAASTAVGAAMGASCAKVL